MSESEKLLGDTPSSTAPAPAHAEPAAPPKAAAAAAPQPLPPPAPAPVAPAAAPAPKPPAAAQPHAAQQLDDDELFFTAQETTFTTPQGGYATLPPSYAPDPLLYSGGGPYHPPQPRFDHAPPAQPGSDAAAKQMEINVGRISSIPVRVHLLLPGVTIAWTLWALMTSARAAWLTFLVMGPVLYATPLGGLAYIAHSGDPKTDLLIAVAGPFTHGPQAVVWGILKGFSIAVGSPGALYVCNSALWMQLSLFCFNLAPAFPLDGGRVVVDACALRAVPLDRAAGLMSWLSLTTGVAVFFLGLSLSSFALLAVGGYIVSSGFELMGKTRRGEARTHPLFHSYEGPMPRMGP